MVPLLLSTLACNAAAQLISPEKNTASDLTALQPSTQTAETNAACYALVPEILKSAHSDETANTSSAIFDGDHEVRYLVVYDLKGDDLGKRDDLLVPDELDNEIDSRASHEYIWNYFTSLIPAEDRTFVTEFSILSDGPNNILAGVSPTYDNPREWTLKVDVEDAQEPYGLSYSLLHEYGHLLTLNAIQVPPNEDVFFHPEDQSLYQQAAADCPRYFTGEGCSNSGSYINDFFNRFWSGFYAEWQATNQSHDQGAQRDPSDDFYEIHKDQFLTRYAATSPEEDLAESWTYFILSPKPEPASIATEKILFFYEYPELVRLREDILNRLCVSFPGN